MSVKYEVIDEKVVKIYESEVLCSFEDIDVVIDRTRETLDRMEKNLIEYKNKGDNSAISIMFREYMIELNELNKLKLMYK